MNEHEFSNMKCYGNYLCILAESVYNLPETLKFLHALGDGDFLCLVFSLFYVLIFGNW